MSGTQDRTTIGLAVVVAVLYFMAYQKTGAFPWGATDRSLRFMVHLIPRMAVGILLGMIVSDILPKEVMEHWLSDRSGWRGHLIGWMAGTFTPVGMPFILYPMAAGLMTGGAGVGPIVTFLTAASLFGPLRMITFELPILGWRFSLLRGVAVFWMPPVAGYLAQMIAGRTR